MTDIEQARLRGFGLSVGRIVHITDTNNVCRAGIIVSVGDKENGVATVTSFHPITGVAYTEIAAFSSESKKPEPNRSFWHIPERD